MHMRVLEYKENNSESLCDDENLNIYIYIFFILLILFFFLFFFRTIVLAWWTTWFHTICTT